MSPTSTPTKPRTPRKRSAPPTIKIRVDPLPTAAAAAPPAPAKAPGPAKADQLPTVSRTTSLYAVAGAGDLVVERLRTVPTMIAAIQPAAVAQLPGRLAQSAASEIGARAGQTYGVLAVRGKSVVTRIRRQQASQDLLAQAIATARRTKAARTTAQQSAAATKAATRGAATSARRTAKAAVRAVEDGAAKVG